MATLSQWRALRRQRVVDQQLWFLGWDIRNAAGNGLLRYGFVRRRSLTGHGSSAYVLEGQQLGLAEAQELVCWGFGLCVGLSRSDATEQAGPAGRPWRGVVLTRFDGTPKLLDVALPTIHQVTELPPLVTPCCDTTCAVAETGLRAIAATLAQYEQWAITALGAAHREAALREAPRHKRHRFVQSPELSAVWQRLC